MGTVSPSHSTPIINYFENPSLGFTLYSECLSVCPCVCLSTFATSNAEKEEADLELPGVPDHQPQEGKEKKKERVALEAS